eukprot:CAMPEP_0117457852 /NCGR_PEP_ID=MMETSP0784-20121206/625_1 /TAXON_ID=39447 /ORGANISM="" /LENGTH=431 /DNA_ID=CAMNT_0005251345 /DNA_START=226 /DNA_END=1518 /DNA_ORIENTATION=-
MVASNEYGEFDGAQYYPWLQSDDNSIKLLIEPHKYTSIHLVEESDGSIPSSSVSSYSYRWEFSTHDGVSVLTVESTPQPEYVFRLTDPGNLKLHVTVTEKDSKSVVQKMVANVYVRYVKRELRDLTAADRERFLDAAHALWEYNTEDGRAKYGSGFTSVETFVEEHALASNDIRCDAFHEGTGFLTRHLALQLSFETSLRAVDPSVTLPYWDFTIEGQQIKDAGEVPSYMAKVTPFLSNEWFGTADDNNHIVDSRWAHTPMYRASDPPRAMPNSYGFLRSYWNNNPEPEITRHMYDVCGLEVDQKAIPFCDTHYAVLNTTDLFEFLVYSPAFGHGPMHVQTGGVGGFCTEGYAALKAKWHDLLSRTYTDEELAVILSTVDDTSEDTVEKVETFRNKYGYKQPVLEFYEKVVLLEYFHIYRGLWRSHICAVD